MRHPTMHRYVEAALWTTAIGALIAVGIGWRTAVPRPGEETMPVAAAPPALSAWSAESLAAATRAVTASDPFRLERRPADVAYGSEPAPVRVAPPPPPKRPPPALTLAGIVGGPPWAALIDGVPGRNGSLVVHAGDVVGGLTVQAVGRDTVVVRGADTTWQLTLKRPWR